MRLSKSIVSFAAAVLGTAMLANAVPVPWSNPNGTIPGVFSWSNGQSDNGLFGSPIVSGMSFTFFPNNFRAVGSNGSAQTTTDRLFFQIDVAPGAADLNSITVTELGDYSILNGGQVSAAAFLFVTNIDLPVSLSNPLTQQASTNPGFPLVVAQPNNASGLWAASAVQALPNGWRRITIVLNNTLQASAPAGGTAIIEKKVGGIRIDIPEPGTLSAALVGIGALLRRRK
jgi:hypothetical protein